MADTKDLTEEQKIALKRFGKDVDALPTKTEEEIAAEKLAEETKLAEAKKKGEEDKLAEIEKEKLKNKPVEVPEPTDEQLLEIASKRSGRKITSWDDLKLSPTEEEKKKEEENRDSAKLSFGLKKGLFNKKQYESFIADSKDPKDLVYSRELAAAKEEDKEWNDEKEKEFKEEFEAKFGLDLDSTAPKYKRGQKQLLMIADNMLRNDYRSIYSLDAEYDKFETEQNNRTAQEQKILQAAPVYKKDAEEVIASFKNIEMDFAGEKYDVPVSAEAIQNVTEALLENGFASSKIVGGYKKEELADIARRIIITENFNELSFEAAKKYREKHEKGIRGIPEGGKLEKLVDQNENLTPEQKKALEFFQVSKNPVIAN